MTETELKLALCETSVGRVRDSGFWRGLRDDGTATNRSIYFDTPDQRLRRSGFTLRQRRVGNHFEQTLKMALKGTAGGGGTLSRREWTWPMEQDGGPLLHLDGVEELGAVEGLSLGDLRPLCEVAYEREKRVWQNNGFAVELALDVGEVRANGHCQAISELELELLSGPPAELFGLARIISGIAPVHPFYTGKGDRGMALLAAPASEWSKPAPLALDHDDVLDTVLSQLFGNCIEHLLANLECARRGSHPEGIHQVRVAIRRLRTLLKLLAPILPQPAASGLEARLGELAGALSPVRDLDVFRGLLGRFVDRAVGDAFAEAQLDRLVAGMQAEAQSQAGKALTSTDFGALMIELGQWHCLHDWCEQPVTANSARLFSPVTAVVGDCLDRQHRKVRKRGKHFAHMNEAERHRLRLAVKRLRYAVDLFGSLYDAKATKGYRRTLSRLQDQLGHDNDVVAAAGIVGQIVERRPSLPVVQAAGAVLGWLRHDAQSRQGAVLKDWEHFVHRAPPWR